MTLKLKIYLICKIILDKLGNNTIKDINCKNFKYILL